jgi:hypothetical protein
LPAQLDHKVGDLAIGQGRVVLDPANLSFCRQQLVEVAAPPCRVLALPVAPSGCPIDDRFDAPPQAIRRFRLCRPNRLDRLQNEPDIDVLHR